MFEPGKYYLYLDSGKEDIDESNCVELDCIAIDEKTQEPSIFAFTLDGKENTCSSVFKKIGNFVSYISENLKF